MIALLGRGAPSLLQHAGVRVEPDHAGEEVGEPHCDGAWAATDIEQPTVPVEVERCRYRARETLGVGDPAAPVVPGRSCEEASVPRPVLPPKSTALGRGVLPHSGCFLAVIHEPQPVRGGFPEANEIAG